MNALKRGVTGSAYFGVRQLVPMAKQQTQHCALQHSTAQQLEGSRLHRILLFGVFILFFRMCIFYVFHFVRRARSPTLFVDTEDAHVFMGGGCRWDILRSTHLGSNDATAPPARHGPLAYTRPQIGPPNTSQRHACSTLSGSSALSRDVSSIGPKANAGFAAYPEPFLYKHQLSFFLLFSFSLLMLQVISHEIHMRFRVSSLKSYVATHSFHCRFRLRHQDKIGILRSSSSTLLSFFLF
jgi:hypothetical protein